MRRIAHTSEEINKIENVFHPLELNEYNVNTIFERCLFNNKVDNNSKEFPVQLLKRDFGFLNQDKPVTFNKDKISQNSKVIAYLLGQLNRVHIENDGNLFNYSETCIKYNGKNWTQSSLTCARLFYLGRACHISGIFKKRDNNTLISLFPDKVSPTLSPSDPNFPAWWEKHKSEWEDKQDPVLNKKSAGTEPADN